MLYDTNIYLGAERGLIFVENKALQISKNFKK